MTKLFLLDDAYSAMNLLLEYTVSRSRQFKRVKIVRVTVYDSLGPVKTGFTLTAEINFLWPPCVTDADIISLPLFLFLFFLA